MVLPEQDFLDTSRLWGVWEGKSWVLGCVFRLTSHTFKAWLVFRCLFLMTRLSICLKSAQALSDSRGFGRAARCQWKGRSAVSFVRAVPQMINLRTGQKLAGSTCKPSYGRRRWPFPVAAGRSHRAGGFADGSLRAALGRCWKSCPGWGH